LPLVAPPSFPTRRSTDLEPQDHVLRKGPRLPREVELDEQLAANERGRQCTWLERQPGVAGNPPGADDLAGTVDEGEVHLMDAELDRKSTRLNSSHVSISY